MNCEAQEAAAVGDGGGQVSRRRTAARREDADTRTAARHTREDAAAGARISAVRHRGKGGGEGGVKGGRETLASKRAPDATRQGDKLVAIAARAALQGDKTPHEDMEKAPMPLVADASRSRRGALDGEGAVAAVLGVRAKAWRQESLSLSWRACCGASRTSRTRLPRARSRSTSYGSSAWSKTNESCRTSSSTAVACRWRTGLSDWLSDGARPRLLPLPHLPCSATRSGEGRGER